VRCTVDITRLDPFGVLVPLHMMAVSEVQTVDSHDEGPILAQPECLVVAIPIPTSVTLDEPVVCILWLPDVLKMPREAENPLDTEEILTEIVRETFLLDRRLKAAWQLTDVSEYHDVCSQADTEILVDIEDDNLPMPFPLKVKLILPVETTFPLSNTLNAFSFMEIATVPLPIRSPNVTTTV
jgi:hypothetical protein